MSNSGPWIISALAACGLGTYPMSYLKERPDALAGIDINAEYALIQEKKSGLSASQRRAVVWRFEKGEES